MIHPKVKEWVSKTTYVRTYVHEEKSSSDIESILRSKSNESSNVESILRSTSNDNEDDEYNSKIIGTHDGNSNYNGQKQ